ETLTRDLFQLLQAAMPANLGRHLGIGKARVPIGDADLADIDVATRVQRDAVGGEEFAGLKSGAVLAAESRDALALRIDDGQARTEIGDLEIDRHARAELADDEGRPPTAATAQRTGPVQIVPLG